MSKLASSFRSGFINMSAPAKLLFLILIIFLFALFGSLLAMVIAIPMFDYTIFELSAIVSNPDENNIGVLKFFQIFQSITLFIFPAVVAAWMFSENTSGYLKANRRTSAITIVLAMLAILSAIPVLNWVTSINMQMDLPDKLNGLEKRMMSMEETAARLTELFLAGHSTTDLLVNFAMIAILPAIGEEFLFRGVIQRLLTEWTKNAHVGIFIGAFIFSFIHFQFYGFLPRFMLGLFFGYLLFWSGSIWVPVAGHLINNGLAVVYYHFTGGAVGETDLDTIGTQGNYLIYLSVFVASLLIAMIFLHEKSNRESFHRNRL